MKPFSHIVMDLFHDAVNHAVDVDDDDDNGSSKLRLSKKQVDEKYETLPRYNFPVSPRNSLSHFLSLSLFSPRSDTDSGRSSDHGSDQLVQKRGTTPFSILPMRGSKKLEVHRMPTIKSADSSPAKKIKPPAENVLQVVRRKRRRETFRRNTIDVNRLDLEDAHRRLLPGTNMDLMNVSKSTNCIDKLLMDERNEFHRKIEEMTFPGGNSLPDLSTDKILGAATETKLKVKRQMDPVGGLKIRKCVSTDDFRMQVTSGRRPEFTGPDFIMKSFVPPKQIDLSAGERNATKRLINVLLLNGRSVQILCNAATINTRQILEAIFRVESYEENYYLGLCVIIGGDFIFLPMDLKVHKVATPGWTIAQAATSKKGQAKTDANVTLSLFVRVKFYLPTLRGLK